MTDDKKPREFNDVWEIISWNGQVHIKETFADHIHVIEYAAYKQLKAERDELRAEVERLKGDYKPSADAVREYRKQHDVGMYIAIEHLKASEYGRLRAENERLKAELTLEREVTSMFKDALKEIEDGINPMGGFITPDGHRRIIANKALNREIEMRDKK